MAMNISGLGNTYNGINTNSKQYKALLQDASDPQTVLPLFDVLHGTKHHKGVSDLNKSRNIILQEL